MFTSLAHLAQYAPGVDTSLTLEDLRPSLRTARKRIEAIITPAVYAAIAGTDDSDENNTKEALRAALANQTLATQLVFDAINRRRSGTDIYKYEIEAMRRAYAENYFSAMDTLISLLEEQGTEDEEQTDTAADTTAVTISPSTPLTPSVPSSPTPATLWQNTRHHQLLASCRIKSAADFDAIYPIDLSHLFFFRTLPLQKEALDERIAAYYDRVDGMNGLSLLHLALAKKTIAKALRRFDPLEFPPTIRNLFDETNATGNRANEQTALLALADRLDQEAEQLLQGVDLMLDSGTDLSTTSAHNLPDDNIFMLP